MEHEHLYRSLRLPKRPKGKIVLLVLDGIGDITSSCSKQLTPLEAARTPQLDELAKTSVMGRLTPVLPGITPGSGPAHLGLFGYDPLETQVARGAIEALGLGIELQPKDIAARANFCSIDTKGIIIDRRAGRITSELNKLLCKKLQLIEKIQETEIIIQPGTSHRFVVVFRGGNIEGPLSDSDPHTEGEPIRKIKPKFSSIKTNRAVSIVNQFYQKALLLLQEERPANGFLLRGISHTPKIPTFPERFELEAAVIATYPMYKGLAKLIGMKALESNHGIEGQFKQYVHSFDAFDYFFIHIKGTDIAGEDGNFEQKVSVIEEVDKFLPILLKKAPQVLAITGDHSTPVSLKAHSWHPPPVLLHSPSSGSDKLSRFTEINANYGSLGIFQSKFLIRLMMANAGLYDKFGA
ncbi:MAG: 2,3-bisphosphoglycerate-independent phosphoglycerate mutase [Acidobacteriia bacterium]|nr:2,3-bisphosphoglycerate-independent phosphoglycerate mutase [Terriglobia bacterium]